MFVEHIVGKFKREYRCLHIHKKFELGLQLWLYILIPQWICWNWKIAAHILGMIFHQKDKGNLLKRKALNSLGKYLANDCAFVLDENKIIK